MISNFRLALNVVCFLLGNSAATEFLHADVSEHSVPSSLAGRCEELLGLRNVDVFIRRKVWIPCV
jgi:hypothetical protein